MSNKLTVKERVKHLGAKPSLPDQRDYRYDLKDVVRRPATLKEGKKRA